MTHRRLWSPACLCGALTLFATSAVGIAAAELVVRAPKAAAPTGAEVEVPLSVAGALGLEGLQFVLRFDPVVLELADVSPAALAGAGEVDQKVRGPGEIRIAMYPEKALAGDGTLLVARFKVLGETGARSVIDLTEARAWKFDAQHPLEMLVTSESGEVIVMPATTYSAPVIWIVAGVSVVVIAGLLLLRRGT